MGDPDTDRGESVSYTHLDVYKRQGSNYLTVRISDDKENPVTYTEFTTLLTDEEIGAAAPAGTSSVTAKSGYTSGTMTLTGTTGGYAQIMDLAVRYGRFLKNTDQDNHSYVVVITSDTAVEFFGHADAEGETLSLLSLIHILWRSGRRRLRQ